MGRHAVHRSARAWWRYAIPFAAVAVVLGVLVAMCGVGPGDSGGKGRAEPDSAGARLGWGFTHTQRSADEGSKTARGRAASTLERTGLPQNQHIMGWGAGNPEPRPGSYDFASLDSRVELITASGGTPVLTLCCAPDWMKGGKAGETDWDELETAPDPEHYADFARLAAKIAARYPQVRHFQVWNEFKGFYDDKRGRWDQEAYTRLYNLVHAEVKKVRPDSLIGGPYLVMDSVPRGSRYASQLAGDWGAVDRRSLDALRYWNAHRAGADFVVVDGSSYTKDRELLPEEFGATEKFTAVGEWVRKETGLPLWWAEWYVEPEAAEDGDGPRWSESRRLAVQAAGMRAMALGGASTALYWNPQRNGGSCPGCLWTHTERPDGGEELPMLALLDRFARAFPPGTGLEDVRSSGGRGLLLLASADTVLAVNTEDRRVTATVDGQRDTWTPYEVRWLER